MSVASVAANSSAAVYDYIVVGSGAGGGVVASNLARANFRVLLIEAGGDSPSPNYSVPAFHPFATEDPAMKRDYYVRHFADDDRSSADPKFCRSEQGVLYPRASTLGGCTAHHAMIAMYPHNSDWDHIAELTGDDSWSAENMRLYFQRMERKTYGFWSRLLYRLTGWNIGVHGYHGWLPISMASPTLLLRSPRLLRLVVSAGLRANRILSERTGNIITRLLHLLFTVRRINHWSPDRPSRQGVHLIPVSIDRGRRYGTRELVAQTRAERPDQLHLLLDSLVVGVLFDGDPSGAPRAIGVRYVKDRGLSLKDGEDGGPTKTPDASEVRCRREVILCAGAFSSPQLLMLSGIGPREELERHGISTRLDRQGVGRNLQDRYELGLVTRIGEPFALLKDAKFRAPNRGEKPERHYRRWLRGKGVYATNGAVLSMTLRSDPSHKEPDLICFGLVGDFRGYYPGYSRDAVKSPAFTWAILKAHTENRGGRITLGSADPTQHPLVNFHYFDEGTGDYQADVDALVAGVRFCRRLNKHIFDPDDELTPGPDVDTHDAIAQFARDHSWGHHASCSCAMGRPEDEMAVVDHRFRVIGARNLRVVDASVFPRIPGFFVVVPVYIIAEKAADIIIADARMNQPS